VAILANVADDKLVAH